MLLVVMPEGSWGGLDPVTVSVQVLVTAQDSVQEGDRDLAKHSRFIKVIVHTRGGESGQTRSEWGLGGGFHYLWARGGRRVVRGL